MQTRPFGRTGLEVSRLALGTMTFGGEADEAESARIYAAARDAGVTLFDTADVYNLGRSEEILGRLVKSERDAVLIASKAGQPRGPSANDGGSNPRHLTRSIEHSLKRLGSDRLDLFYIHKFDPKTPIETALRALEEIRRAGKAVHLGVSNFAAWQIATALGVQARMGWAGFDAVQPMYNLVKRQAEVEILPLAQAAGLAVFPYSPLGGGLLTGKYAGADAGGRLSVNAMYATRYGEAWAHETAAAFAAKARTLGVEPASLAIAWAMAHPGVTAPLVGARNVAQLKTALAAANIDMTPDLRAEISALSRRPAPPTDRLEEASQP